MKKRLCFLPWLGVLVLVLTGKVWACSSCSTGGADVLILNPLDQQRLYLGYQVRWFWQNIDSTGEAGPVLGVKRREQWTLAIGERLGPDHFFTVAMPLVRNQGDRGTETGLGDPALQARWTVRRQNIAGPLIPQVQMLAGIKPRFAPSTIEAQDQRSFLDATGSGYTSLNLGVDLWSGMTAWQYGGSYRMVYHFPETKQGQRQEPGLEQILNLSMGWATDQAWKHVFGLVHQRKAAGRLDGQRVSHGRSLQHQFFWTTTFSPTLTTEWKFTLVAAGGLFSQALPPAWEQVNATVFHQLQLAWIWRR